MLNIIRKTIGEKESSLRLDKWLYHLGFNLSFSYIQKICRSGEVRVNSKRVKSSYRLKTNDIVRFPTNTKKTSQNFSPNYSSYELDLAKQISDKLLYQDNNYVILNKPANLAVQGGTNIICHLDKLLPAISKNLKLHKKSLYLTHRLDRGTSGIIVISKSSIAAKEICEAFKNRQIRKKYLAICQGIPEKHHGVISMHLTKDKSSKNQRVMKHDVNTGKKSITYYSCLSTVENKFSLLELRPVTGRSHQLRAACKKLGCPIVGDKIYNENPSDSTHLLLHAWELEWPEKNYKLQAPIPKHFNFACVKLGMTIPTKQSPKKASHN